MRFYVVDFPFVAGSPSIGKEDIIAATTLDWIAQEVGCRALRLGNKLIGWNSHHHLLELSLEVLGPESNILDPVGNRR